MRTVEITADALDAANRIVPADTPVMMINLLRYRDQADYGDRTDVTPCSGREAYRRYADVALKCVEKVGARVFWSGSVLGSVLCPDGERWDDVLLVEYPSFACSPQAFVDPEYQAVAFHRTAALEDSRLIATTR